MPPPFLSLLRASTTLAGAREIHAQILLHGFPLHQNHLLAKLAGLRPSPTDYALAVFAQIPSPNDHSFSSLIRSLSTLPSSSAAAAAYICMLRRRLTPTAFTFPFVLKSSAALSSASLGRQLHAHVLKSPACQNPHVANSLIHMYSKRSHLEDAHKVFHEMPLKDHISYNSLVAGYAHLGDLKTALDLFESMPVEERTVAGWTALIDGFGQAGLVDSAFRLFRRMLVSADDDAWPNSATMVCLLSACADSDAARWVSAFLDVNFPTTARDAVLSTALVSMHARCGEIGKSRKVFDGIPNKGLVTWNAMLTGYVRGGFPDEAMELARRMMSSASVEPDEITMAGLLSACASSGALEAGRQAHWYLARKQMHRSCILVTALVDMYSKCGSIGDACLAFIKSAEKDVILWNAMILGLAVHGHGRDALAIFARMRRTGDKPNDATFIGVLSACSHSGLVKEGRINFRKMRDYGLNPKVEHYACLVDLLGRSGHLGDALALVRSMEIPLDSVIWGSLLNACRIHRNVEVADEVGRLIASSENPGLGSCVLLANIYASVNRWADVAKWRRFVREKTAKKPSGFSWIEVEGSVHQFLAEDATHTHSGEVRAILRRMMEHPSVDGSEPEFFKFESEGIE